MSLLYAQQLIQLTAIKIVVLTFFYVKQTLIR